MANLSWVVYLLLFLVMLVFAGRNLDDVHVHGFLGYEWQAPLVVVMLASLVVGVVLGVAGALRTALFLRARSRLGPSPAELELGPPVPAGLRAARAGRDLPDLDEGA